MCLEAEPVSQIVTRASVAESQPGGQLILHDSRGKWGQRGTRHQAISVGVAAANGNVFGNRALDASME